MPDGGTLHLKIENIDDITNENNLQHLETDSKYVKITLRDEGSGISEEVIDKIFDPYFSTKEMGANKGMGLGLAIAHSILLKHNGDITAQSTPGEGASVSFYLPAQPQPRPDLTTESAVADKEISGTTNKKILIMDDEKMVLEVVCSMLQHHNYLTDTAQDGQEAVKKFQEAIDGGDPFGVVIMDLTIPGGMGGRETVTEVLKINPNAKIVVASGYSNDPVMENFSSYGFSAAISKPFRSAELLDIINKL